MFWGSKNHKNPSVQRILALFPPFHHLSRFNTGVVQNAGARPPQPPFCPWWARSSIAHPPNYSLESRFYQNNSETWALVYFSFRDSIWHHNLSTGLYSLVREEPDIAGRDAPRRRILVSRPRSYNQSFYSNQDKGWLRTIAYGVRSPTSNTRTETLHITQVDHHHRSTLKFWQPLFHLKVELNAYSLVLSFGWPRYPLLISTTMFVTKKGGDNTNPSPLHTIIYYFIIILSWSQRTAHLYLPCNL